MTLKILNPYAVPGEFRKAQLHCHTTESDGRFRPRDLLQMYRDAGYAFVCLTDHNRVTREPGLDGEGFVTILGTEDTVTRLVRPLGPHLGRLFVEESLPAGTAQERIDKTVASGGIASLCHPSWTGNLWTGTWSMDAVRGLWGFQLMEIWNPHTDTVEDVRRWAAALAARGPQAPVWGIAVDDCHTARQFNQGWTMVKVPSVSGDALRRALLAGACYGTTGLAIECRASGSEVAVRTEPGTVIRFVDRDGKIRVEGRGPDARYAVRGDEGYVRVEGAMGDRQAWSQPFWVQLDVRNHTKTTT